MNGFLFLSNDNGKTIFRIEKNVLVTSYCSISSNCPAQNLCQSCERTDAAKSYLETETPDPNSDIVALGGELIAGIGEYKIGKNVFLKTMGLGSCVGVVLFDVSAGIAGIAHILLPGASENGETKYAETAIEKMLEDLIRQGARKSRITAKFAGGAQVFKQMNLEIFKIGNRNVKSVEATLIKKKIPILAKDAGGTIGRNLIFNPVDGTMIVKYTKGETLWL
jgi:chemotaxis protein CheD